MPAAHQLCATNREKVRRWRANTYCSASRVGEVWNGMEFYLSIYPYGRARSRTMPVRPIQGRDKMVVSSAGDEAVTGAEGRFRLRTPLIRKTTSV